MSVRASRFSPASACSGLMYAAVPRIIPTPVIIAGVVIIMLPMFGDFFTADLLGTSKNAMIGSLVNLYVTTFTQGASQGRGAALVIVLSLVVSVLTLYYLINTARASREARA